MPVPVQVQERPLSFFSKSSLEIESKLQPNVGGNNSSQSFNKSTDVASDGLYGFATDDKKEDQKKNKKNKNKRAAGFAHFNVFQDDKTKLEQEVENDYEKGKAKEEESHDHGEGDDFDIEQKVAAVLEPVEASATTTQQQQQQQQQQHTRPSVIKRDNALFSLFSKERISPTVSPVGSSNQVLAAAGKNRGSNSTSNNDGGAHNISMAQRCKGLSVDLERNVVNFSLPSGWDEEDQQREEFSGQSNQLPIEEAEPADIRYIGKVTDFFKKNLTFF